MSHDIPLYKTSCIECSSSDAMQVYQRHDGTLRGYCYSCEKSFHKLENDGGPVTAVKPKFEGQKGPYNVAGVEQVTTISEIVTRKIPKDVSEKYGIRLSFNEETGEEDKHYYPIRVDGQISGYKERQVSDKTFRVIGSAVDCELFGQSTCGANGKLLVITEGELDAVAAYQMFKLRGKNYRVCSLPNGANIKAMKTNIEWLETFDNIFLAFDQDGPGQDCAKKAANLFTPGKVKIMHFSEKDPSDMLKAGKEMEFFSALYSAKEYRPDGIVSVEDIYEEAIKPVEWGLSWPWETLTKATYGYRRKEIYGIGGASGGGKTEYCKELIDHIINVHQNPVGVIFLEEPVSKTLKVLAGKKFNKRFHVPDGGWTIDELKSGISDLKGKVYLYNHFGGKDWEAIKAKIRYMVISLGIKDIVLDHLTALIAQEDNEYKALNRIMEEMASLTQELDFTLFYVSHLRKPGGTPHEEGGRVSADQFKGSGAIVYWSNFLFGIERNQQAEDDTERNTTLFRILKDRNTGLGTGRTFELWYDHTTGRWREKKDDDGLDDL